MVRFSLRSWLNCVAPGHSARNRRLTPHRIERLEERLVLSAYSVTSTLDSVDANPGDGVAADVDGNATLRAAVIDANALAGTDTITLGSGVFTLTLSGLNENAAATGDLDVTGDLVIEGAGADQTFLDAALLDRYFHVQPGSSLTLRNLTIRNGREVNGGAIENDGTLVLENVDLTGNAAVMRGGAIYNLAGNVTLQSVHVTGNQALGSGDAIGGGLVSTGGSVTIVDSQFSNNAAAMEGGAINSRTTTLQVTNTAFSNNSANSGGAIRLFSGTASLTNNTFSGDHATTSGGAISSGSCTLTITGGSFTGNYLAPMPVTGGVRTGGVLYLSGQAPSGVTIKYVTFQQTGSGDGGAIYNSNGALSLSYSTFDRVTGDRGGSIWNGNGGFISMWNTTIAGGSGTNGGAIFNTSGGQLQVRNSTISNNTSTGVPGEGGDFFTAFGAATMGVSSVINSGAVHNASGNFVSLNNLIAGNVGGLDVYGSFSSSGGNLIGNGTGGYGFTAPTDHVGTAVSPINPLLSPLANNGGQVQTMAISAQSPARDGGTFGAPLTDARGLPRTGLAPDAGAYEYQNQVPVAGPFNVTTNEDQVLTGQLTGSDADGDTLTYEVTMPAFIGTLSVQPNGQFTYTPQPDFSGTVTFRYRVSDGGSYSNEVVGRIVVQPVNDPPVVADQTFTVAENSQNGSFVGFVEASDIDSSTLTFQIVSGNESGIFGLNQLRILYVTNSSLLNFETTPTVTLVVRITGNGTPATSTLATITVHLTDANDAPKLPQQTTFNVNENSPNGTVVGTIPATDDDAGQSLTYEFSDSNVNGPFAINPVTGEITVIDEAAVSVEYQASWGWMVRVTDNGNPALSTEAWVFLHLRNVNDAPTVADQSFTIEENSQYGSFVGHVEASDPDGYQLTGQIVSGNENGAFAFNSYDRTLYVANPSLLNFETNPTLTLVVRISDGGSPVGSSLATITVNLADVNELPQPAAAAFTVDENAANGTVLGTVTSTDPDVGQTLTFAIAASDVPGAFAIDPATGQVTVADGSLLNFESPANYSLLISVTDSGTPALTQYSSVTIQVNDVNEAPQIAPSAFSLDENSPNDTVVGTVIGTDPDAGQSLTYTITSGNTNGAFAINAATGEITVADAAALNFEATPTFNLVVSVADNSTPSLASNAVVTMTLTDVNEAPQISTQSFSLAENSANSTVVGTVSAADPDAGQSLTYSIASGNTNGAFTINAATGQITVANAAALNFETTSTFNLVVNVTDSSTPSLASSAAVTITLTNVNEAPAIAPLPFSLVENSANGTVVGTITGTDPDVGQPLTYSITSGNTGGAFAINPTTGEITVANSALLNFETTPSFSLVVSITDDGTPGLTASATVTISLQNANDAPLFVNKSFTLNENSANATVVGTITATDADPGQSLTYAIISGNTNGAFSINATTGQVRVASSAALNFEVTPVFNLVIRATDNGTPSQSSTATATISLANVNEAPQISAQSFSVAENSVNGTLVAAVAGFDPDAGQPLTYSIVSGNTNGAFSINATTGQITVANAAALNFEATTAFNLVVRIADNGTPSLTASATVSISVTNVNEAPLFPAKSFTLSENSANGTVVGTTTATDPDAGQSRTYSIVSGNPNGAFSINATTGQIKVANSAALNFETNPVFGLVVRATDNGTPSASTDTTMTITLTNVNETPLIAAQSFSVAENSANGTVVGSVVASDPDAGQSLTYSITSGNTNSAFTINAATGQIKVANVAALNFETQPTFTLQVKVTDNGSPTRTSTATVTISLSDVLEPLAVAIDVVPGSSSNTIRVGRTFELAILSTASFDARNVNVATVRFGKLGTENSGTRNTQGQLNYSYRDVNNDGRLDLVIEISTDATGLQVGDTLARFTGSLNNGQTLTGSSSVVVRR